MAEHHFPGLEDLNIESMVSARMSDEFNWRSGVSPVRHRPTQSLAGVPVVELGNENERRHSWTGADHAAPRIEGNRVPRCSNDHSEMPDIEGLMDE